MKKPGSTEFELDPSDEKRPRKCRPKAKGRKKPKRK